MSSMGGPPQDASLFVSSLLGETKRSKELELHHEPWKGTKGVELYKIPMEEFNILHWKVKGEDQVPAIDGPCIWIVTDGAIEVDDGRQKETLHTGQVVFIRPGTALKVNALQGAEAWGAFCE